jgi:hypothetical protein
MKTMNVKVIPNARKDHVYVEEGRFKVHVKAPATGGKANKAMIELLADFLKVKESDIRIIRGEKSREKVIEVNIGEDYKC